MSLNRDQIFLVGGAVRDELLGLEVKDRDWVVVGSTPEAMVAAGYRPVGTDFPVFIDPKSGEEYALARTERKSGRGYKGFTFHTDPNVSLEEDLIRRDLRINAIAKSSAGVLIDPYDGLKDIEERRLRHISPAFREDPLRVLRVARFVARFAPLGFEVAEETLALMTEISRSGELAELTPERVWQELERALNTDRADRFFETLARCDALHALFPEFSVLPLPAFEPLSDPSLPDAPSRFARLFQQLSDLQHWPLAEAERQLSAFCVRLRVPNRYRDLTLDLLRHHNLLADYPTASAEARLKLLSELKLQRSLERLRPLIPLTEQIHQHPVALEPIERDLQTLATLQPKDLMAEGFSGAELGQELKRRQIERLSY